MANPYLRSEGIKLPSNEDEEVNQKKRKLDAEKKNLDLKKIKPQLTLAEEQIEKCESLLQNGYESYYNDLDLKSKFLEIKKKWITFNNLPPSRYGNEDHIKVIGPTNMDNSLAEFLEDKIQSKVKYVRLTGPSGIGKSYSLLKQVLMLKQKFEKKSVVIHVTLTPDYTRTFCDSFLQDLIFAFSCLKDYPDFPEPPPNLNQYVRITDRPNFNKLQKWYFNIRAKPINIEGLTDFFLIVGSYLEDKNIRLFVVVDQQNVFFSQQISMNEQAKQFLNDLMNGEFSTFVIISASNANEGFDDLKNPDSNLNVLEINHNFEEKNSKLFFENILEDPISNEEIEEILEITGNVALELSSFCTTANVNNNLSFDEKKTLYVTKRSAEIFDAVAHFYIRKTIECPEWKVRFLTEFYQYLDTDHTIKQMAPITTIDRRFMFIEDKKLRSLSPISKEVLDQFYFPKLSEYMNSINQDLSKVYFDIYKYTPKGSFAGHLFEKMVISKFMNHIKHQTAISIKYNDLEENSLKNLQPFTLNFVEYFDGRFSENEKFDNNYFFLPLKANNPYTDFFFFTTNNKTLYAVQVTINISTHSKSDTYFKQKIMPKIIKPGVVEQIIFIWITRKEEIQSWRAHFEKSSGSSKFTPKSKDSWIVFVEDNKDLWFDGI